MSNLFPNKGEEDPLPTVLDRLEKNNFIIDASFESEWRSLLRPPLDPEIGEITDAPVFFAGIGFDGGLDSAIGIAMRTARDVGIFMASLSVHGAYIWKTSLAHAS